MRFDKPRYFRQSMSWVHTWTGLVMGWLLFAVYVTGALSYFRNEITLWMQPELHAAAAADDWLPKAVGVLAEKGAQAQQWTIAPPGPRRRWHGRGRRAFLKFAATSCWRCRSTQTLNSTARWPCCGTAAARIFRPIY